jgi:hypothetical protein
VRDPTELARDGKRRKRSVLPDADRGVRIQASQPPQMKGKGQERNR